jgi:hypothetical protein
MKSILRHSSLAILSALALACSSERDDNLPPGNNGGGGDSLELSKLDEETLKATCAALFRCEAHSRLYVGIKLALIDEATCRTRLAESFGDDYQDLALAVAAGTVRYDGKAAKQCVASYGSASCVDFGEGPPAQSAACRTMFTGTIALDAACRRHEECAGDSYCALTGTSTATDCAGQCKPRLALGMPCFSKSQCVAAANAGEVECSAPMPTGTATCREISTLPAAALGAACGSDRVAGTETPCGPNLFCDSTAHCAARIAPGASCMQADECSTPDTICRAPPMSTARVCGPVTLVATAGSVCDQESLLCSPAANLTCDLETGRCVAGPSGGALGAACENELFGSPPCNAGLYCAFQGEQGSTCQAKVAIGMPCDGSDEQCTDSFCVNGTCSARDCHAI